MADNDELTGISIAGTPIEWNHRQGTCTINTLPVIMLWVDSTLTSLMSGVQAMLGTERFSLALQSEGRKSVVDDWRVICAHSNFQEGFRAIARIAAAAGWGNWQLISTDYERKECIFHITNSWEGRYQKSLGVNWGCDMLAGKLAGYCSRLFDAKCWAEQTSFTALGDSVDTFIVKPSSTSIEEKQDTLLATGMATGPEMAIALKKLEEEIQARTATENMLRRSQLQLEQSVLNQTAKYQESESNYRTLVENTNDLIAQFNVHGRLTFINKAAQKILDLSPAEYFGRSIFRFIHPDDRKRVITWWRKCIADKTCSTYIELRQVNVKTGVTYDVQWSASFQYDTSGRLTGIGIIGRDVSEMRRAEYEKTNVENQLKQRHKMESIGFLTGGIVHDFNNILAAILGYADMALEEIPERSPAYNQIKEVVKAGNRAKNLVKQILAFSRKERAHLEPVNLNALITEVVVFLRATIPSTIDIRLHLDPDCGNILGDQTQLHQVLMNICTNASQAMEAEGGILAIRLREAIRDDEDLAPAVLQTAESFLRLDISDNGSGIPEKYLECIFDPYFTTKETGKGFGLGLAVVHSIVKSHNGLIKVSNNPERGTTFTLLFPRIDTPVQPVEVKKKSNGRGNERILVVDDEPSISKMLEIFFSRSGYSVLALSSSTQALEIFRNDPEAFDLVLTDMTMPGLTGDNLALAIRQLRPDIPIILCTGYSSRIDEMQAREKGIQAFVMKPVNFQELNGIVRRLLDHS